MLMSLETSTDLLTLVATNYYGTYTYPWFGAGACPGGAPVGIYPGGGI